MSHKLARRSTNLLRHVAFLVEAGAMPEPTWLQALQRCPPPRQVWGRKPPTITFPEDRLLQAYYAKHPEAKLEPVTVGSFDPPTARRFVSRQQELMQQGVERKEAFKQVEQEFSQQRVAAGLPESSGLIQQVQREEEVHLRRALREYNARRGHDKQ